MIRNILIAFIIITLGCTSTTIDCTNSLNYHKLDTLLSKETNGDEHSYFFDPDFKDALIKQMCKQIRNYRTITYVEIKSLFSQERKGAIYLHDSDKYYSFHQSRHAGELTFRVGLEKNSALYKIISFLKGDFKVKVDKLKAFYSDRKIMDAPLLRIIYIDDSPNSMISCSTITPFLPEDFSHGSFDKINY